MRKEFDLKDIESSANVIVWDGNNFIWDDKDFNCILELDSLPGKMDFILKKVGSLAKESNKVEIDLDKIIPSEKNWWILKSSERIIIPIGRGVEKTQYLELGKGMAHNCLIVGRIGSGKSTLLHVIITGLGIIYSPEEIELYLIDFKKGTEFKTYATNNMPHARVIALQCEREFGLSALQKLEKELDERAKLFNSLTEGGTPCRDISVYRKIIPKPLPRILLIVDEFQGFFEEDDDIASKASSILDHLVRQGRVFGIHTILCSQTLVDSRTFIRSFKDQMTIRIALQCSDDDSRLILADDNPSAKILSRPGEAIYNSNSGGLKDNNTFQVAWLSDNMRDDYFKKMLNKAKMKNISIPPQIVFEGESFADPKKNRKLLELLTAFPPKQKMKNISAWIGQPIAIKESTALVFNNQRENNLLIIGQNDKAALGMVSTSLISLAAHYKQDDVQIYIVNLSPDDECSAMFDRLSIILPYTQFFTGKDLPLLLDTLYTKVNDNVVNENYHDSIYLVIFGLQKARELKEDDDFTYSSDENKPKVSPAKQFSNILKEGPDIGIHTLVWCDSYSSLKNKIGRNLIQEFDLRVVLQMGTDESNSLIDTSAANKLGPFGAYYYSINENRLEKFQPYNLPIEDKDTDNWLNWVKQQFRKA